MIFSPDLAEYYGGGHFIGLLKAIRDQNIGNFQARVEKRDLSEYEEVM